MSNVSASQWADMCRAAYANWLRTKVTNDHPVIIGQAGSNRGGSRHGTAMFPNPRTTAGYRLFKMTGMTLDEYVSGFERFNTITRFPGQSGRGHKFPMDEASLNAKVHIITRCLNARRCVIIGKANAKAYFDVIGRALPEPLTWVSIGLKGEWVWMPHTSGIVQFWNQPGNADRCRAVFDAIER